MARRVGRRNYFLLFLLFALPFTVLVALKPIRILNLFGVGNTYYVSRTGSNADGRSWASAWNELSRINWGVIQPGDTIVIDGGSTPCPSTGFSTSNCGMVYNTTLSVGKSGTQTSPIIIRLATDAGRNGTVVIDGKLKRWTRCSAYPFRTETPPSSGPGTGDSRSNVNEVGVKFNNSQWVNLDGIKWGGIEVRNNWRYGVSFGGSKNTTARYLKIYNNTDPGVADNHSAGFTMSHEADNVKLLRSEVFKNGQDAGRGGGDRVYLEENWIHDQYCNHPDGIQAFVANNRNTTPSGEMTNIYVRRNVFENVTLQPIFLGENSIHDSWAVNVEISDNLIVNGGDTIKSKNTKSRNWDVHNNTIVNSSGYGAEWCCASPGAFAPMKVRNNIFYKVPNGTTGRTALITGTVGTYAGLSGETEYRDNCAYQSGSLHPNVRQYGTNYTNENPQFVNMNGGDYRVQNSKCTGRGSSITSVSQLLALAGPIPTVAPTSAVTATVTPTRSLTPVPTPAPIRFEAEGGTIVNPFVKISYGTKIRQTIETVNPAQGGKASYSVNIRSSGRYKVNMRVFAATDASNSLFVNFDQDPASSDNPNVTVWDITKTSSDNFDWRTLTWRGSGGVESPQFSPKVFDLTTGTHTLFIRGREADTRIDRIEVIYFEPLR